VNDDGSEDTTLNILKTYQKKWGVKKLHIRKGPQKGFAQNFLQIINDKKINADFYFLSDQDDVWMSHKVSHTIKKISKRNNSRAMLYCARTTYVSSDTKKILGQSELFSRPPSFKNALVQSIAGGNTMAFNSKLKDVVGKFKAAQVISHDWWLYIVNELMGGVTLYDSESTIFYRQHQASLIGNNTTLLAKTKRLYMLLKGTYRDYNSCHLDTLNMINIPSTKENLYIIDRFSILRDGPLSDRIKILSELGLYRQSWDTHLGLYLGAIIHKL
jgi:glycosyltransferase involved in cell wall biosynthesis